MAKDFDGWNARKKHLDGGPPSDFYFYEREVWWCSVGTNLGVEIDGKNENYERPVLIVRKFNRNMFWGVPVTSKEHSSPFYKKIATPQRIYWIVLSQLRLWSSKRLLRKIELMSEVDFEESVRVLHSLLP